MYRVFVFPTSNEPGLEIIHALSKSNKIALFGGSSGDTSYDPAKGLLEHFEECPWFDEPNFLDRFAEILKKWRIDLLFPAWDRVVAQFAAWKECPCRVVAPNADTAGLLLSKSAVYRQLSGLIPMASHYADTDSVSFPAFAKPDQGSGSKDIYYIANEEDLAAARSKGLLISDYLPGKEYTVDCFNDMSGNLLVAHVRLRAKIGRGIALGGESVEKPDILEYCRIISKHLPIEGPWFAQFKEDKQGTACLLEINARIAGSMGMTRYAGVNIPLMSAFQFMGESVRAPRLRANRVNRSLNFIPEPEAYKAIIWDFDDTLLRKDGKPDPEAMAYLYDAYNRNIKQLLLSKNPLLHEKLRASKIPDLFDEVVMTSDKVGELPVLLKRHHLLMRDCIMVNDSYQELFALQELFPELRVIFPDGLARLGRELLR